MRSITLILFLAFPLHLSAGPSDPKKYPPETQYTKKDQYFKALPPEEAIKTIEVPDGYHLECVASEPMVEEPASFAFDGNGAIYVCEWLTYMQDEKATGQMDPVSRVVKLVDTDGDGRMDKRTVFIDNVLLPRTVLPAGDRILVNFTGSTAIWSYYDDDGDGIADGRELAYEGHPDNGNIEHQSSGLLWNLDNYIYNNYKRFKYENGKLIPESHSIARISQWGLARDDDGRIYCSQAGGHKIALNFQLPGGYPILNLGNRERGPEGDRPFAICKVEDQSSGNYDFKNDRVLTEFSACCGQTIIRSPLMPEFYGSMATCEPVARLIRLSQFKIVDGIRVAYNQFPGSEFIRGTDAFFRPVWTETGPDGCFYFSDMYRGIIQEKTWFPSEEGQGPAVWVKRYKRVKEWGMLKVFRHGRIYRLVPDDKKPTPMPKMLDKSSVELVPYLSHKNGWWRDKAQQLIVIRGGKSAVPDLQELIKGTEAPDAKITALWCLEGLSSLDENTVAAALEDKDARVRVAAVHLAEAYIQNNNRAIVDKVKAMSNDDDGDVRMQVFLAIDPLKNPSLKETRNALAHELAGMTLVQEYTKLENEIEARAMLDATAQAGAIIYESLCITCHGKDGKGLEADGKLMAPTLSRNRWMTGGKNTDVAIAIVLKGEIGEIKKRSYGEGLMLPLEHAYNDEQIANVLNYVGLRWNNWKQPITAEKVASVRKAVADRKTPYTQNELNALFKNVRARK